MAVAAIILACLGVVNAAPYILGYYYIHTMYCFYYVNLSHEFHLYEYTYFCIIEIVLVNKLTQV